MARVVGQRVNRYSFPLGQCLQQVDILRQKIDRVRKVAKTGPVRIEAVREARTAEQDISAISALRSSPNSPPSRMASCAVARFAAIIALLMSFAFAPAPSGPRCAINPA